MKDQKYKVEISNFKNLHELPDYWNASKYKELLNQMEYGDSSDLDDKEAKEMCLISLSDYEPEEAAKLVLAFVFEEELNSGQIDNLSNEMLTEKLWEEYADIKFHERFFNCHQILFDAYNGKFPNTEAIFFNMTIIPLESSQLKLFIGDNLEPQIVRLLASGMPQNAVINRLYKDEIKSETFPEADHILWQYKRVEDTPELIKFSIISSNYWFKDLKYSAEYEGESHPDVDEIVDED